MASVSVLALAGNVVGSCQHLEIHLVPAMMMLIVLMVMGLRGVVGLGGGALQIVKQILCYV
jgi:hypothetical protein